MTNLSARSFDPLGQLRRIVLQEHKSLSLGGSHMRMPARMQPLLPALIASLVLTIAGFYLFGRFGGFSNPLNRNLAGTPSEIPNVVAVTAMRATPVPQPLSLLTRDAAVLSHSVGAVRLQPQVHPALPGGTAGQGNLPAPQRPFSRSSQLIRTARMSIEVQNIDRAVRAASAIADGELGDIINLDYQSGSAPNGPQTATMQLRVPQYRFANSMDELAALGKVTSRSVSAQDVADQIVDAQARLRNLHHTEGDILKIMDRYGDIEQVLRVTQELFSVREQIELLDAQLKGMQYQVAYSTITIDFATPLAAVKPAGGTAVLAAAWHAALAALETLTLALLSFGLWLLAFSPYALLLGLALFLALRRRHAGSTAG